MNDNSQDEKTPEERKTAHEDWMAELELRAMQFERRATLWTFITFALILVTLGVLADAES